MKKYYSDDHLFRSSSDRYGNGLPMSLKAVLVVFVMAVIVYGMTACGNKDSTPAPPTDTADIYTGRTFFRLDSKSSTAGKAVYYYLTFKKNFQIDSYIKYNKTESTNDQFETGTYKTGQSSNFLLTFKSGTYPADFQSPGFVIHYPTGDVGYVAE